MDYVAWNPEVDAQRTVCDPEVQKSTHAAAYCHHWEVFFKYWFLNFTLRDFYSVELEWNFGNITFFFFFLILHMTVVSAKH